MSDGAKESVELLPCPLCQSEGHTLNRGFCFVGETDEREDAVRCPTCGCRATLKAWNTRATPPAAPDPANGLPTLDEYRNNLVEECALIAESSAVTSNGTKIGIGIATKIRALAVAPAQSIENEGEREAAIERIISIRNGMTPDMEARAIVRRELAAFAALKETT